MNLKNKTILFQGDSITDMNRGRDLWDQNHIYGHSYVFLLASLFGCEYPEEGIRVINRGVSGNQCQDLLDRWQEDAIDLQPDVISILVGVNDFGRKERPLYAGDYTRIMTQIIEDTRKALPDTEFIICEPFSFPDAAPDGRGENLARYTAAHQAAARALAETHGFVFVPLQEEFDRARREHPEIPPTHWIWDGVHPTAAGHRLIYKKWLRCVRGESTLR